MNEAFRKTISDLLGYPVDINFEQIFEEDGIKCSDVIAIVQCKHLKRIADSLEVIKSSAEILEKLTDCISSAQGGSQFCITGDVTSYGS